MNGKSHIDISRGVFYGGLIQGLDYRTQTISGMTNEKGEYEYREGESVTFSVGALVLGSSSGNSVLTPAHLVIEVGGDVKKIRNQFIKFEIKQVD